MTTTHRKVLVSAALTAAIGLGVAACAPPGSTGASGGPNAANDTSPITIGVVASVTGAFSNAAQQCIDGIHAGLDYATDGTKTVNGRPVDLIIEDDGFDTTKVAGAVTNLVGKGASLIIACDGSDQALAASELAAQNQFLLITGPGTGDSFTGKNKYTFRASLQSGQVSKAMAVAAGDVSKQTIGLFSLNSVLGQTFEKSATNAFQPEGATVKAVLVPPAATDLTPYAQQLLQSGGSTFLVNWVGASTSQMWSALNQQGVLDAGPVFTTLDYGPTHALLAPAVGKAKVVSQFFNGATDNEQVKALAAYLEKHGVQSKVPDVYSSDGWNAGVMAVHAFEASTTDVEAMTAALKGWKFDAPVGAAEIRAEDHAFIQPVYVGDLVDIDGVPTAKLIDTVPAQDAAPPIVTMGG